MMRHWEVFSPTWDEVDPILDDGTGPTEATCDSVYVAAGSKREAIRLGVKHLHRWVDMQRGDGCNPFSGVTAELCQCEHGFCWCDIPGAHPEQGGHCEACEADDLRVLLKEQTQ